MKTNIDWQAVRADLDSQDWQENDGNFERTCFLGTVFRLFPSGKYYTPWANSNVDPCPFCKGSGHIVIGTRRQRKKWESAYHHYRQLVHKRGVEYARNRDNTYYMDCYHKLIRACDFCGGLGSREAYLDVQYRELLGSEADEHGLFITAGEGDPCDVFAGECRDAVECDDCGETVPANTPHECETREVDAS